MIISTKGRYALRVMLDLAQSNSDSYTPLKEIAERQKISQKYLESIMTVLSKAGFLDALHGKGGGYRLNRPPEDYTVGSILKLAEGTLSPVACLDGGKNCERSADCRSLPMWIELDKMIDDYFESITVADLLKNECADFESLPPQDNI
ncbi:MAG: RrF2 family transcriptional regulator [Clostridiales bacterium]|nr:RrF2 family transcriptional regulator [Clostridiales bacterium]